MKKDRRTGAGPNLQLEDGGTKEARINRLENGPNLLSFSGKKLFFRIFGRRGEDDGGNPTLSSVSG